jgi:peptidoglycan/xylan/chitin deacetylase (PgdA/CDA1 family)
MLPDEPGRPRPGTPDPSDVTRRRLLTAAGLLATAGAGEVVWKVLNGPSDGTQRLVAATDPGTTGNLPTVPLPSPSPTAHATSLATPTPTPTPTPHVTATPVRHVSPGDPPGHGHGKAPRRRAKVEHVTLPPARVPVQHQPAYYVHDLLPNAPKRAIALTIDDGPDPDWTPKVLRLLDKYDVQATFCVVGVHVTAYPNLVRDVHRAGHAIVNHSWSHPLPFASLTEKQIVAQILDNQRAIERAAGVTPELFRAPGGEWSPFIYRALAAYGLRPLDWDVDPADWSMPGTRRVVHRMLKARPNDIVLCHDGGGNRHETVQALRTVLPAYKRRKLDLVTLSLPASDAPKPVTSPTPTASPTSSPKLASPTPTATP